MKIHHATAIMTAPTSPYEACSKPVDPESPDVERGGHLICLDYQSDILASSLA